MESSTSESPSFGSSIPFKSQKPFLTTPVKSQPPVGPAVLTPDRFNNPPSRIRNQNFALSVSDVRRTALQLRKSNPASSVSGSSTVVDQLKRVGPSARKVKGSDEAPACLPQKYEMLYEFFNAMVSSIRLLRLKRQPATLTKLSRNIESLTDRRFTLHHLAQLKHIVPEVIVVKKIRVQDEETSCMKEDLLISLEADMVETAKIAKGSVGYSHLKGIFHSRVIDYAATHPEGVDVPEGELPDLFYKPKQQPEPSMNQTSILQPKSLAGPSFKRRFSSRAIGAPAPEPSLAKPLPVTPLKEAASDAAPVKVFSTPGQLTLKPAEFACNPAEVLSTPTKFDSAPEKFASTPAEAVLTPVRLMSATPALRTPKRSLVTDDHATDLPMKSVKRRALRFEENCDDAEDQTCQDSDEEIDVLAQSSAVYSKDLLDVLPENLLHSLMEKEQRNLEEQNPIVLQALKRKQLMAGVPKLFEIVQLLFQSIRRSVMTKEELIHKILTGHLDIVDRREIEDQLKLLQDVAPEFITEQTSLSGDILLRLNKSSCAESIRAKLLEAQ